MRELLSNYVTTRAQYWDILVTLGLLEQPDDFSLHKENHVRGYWLGLTHF